MAKEKIRYDDLSEEEKMFLKAMHAIENLTEEQLIAYRDYAVNVLHASEDEIKTWDMCVDILHQNRGYDTSILQ